MLALAVLVFGSAVQVSLQAWIAVAAIVVGLAGLALFNVSLLARVGGRDRLLAGVNAELTTSLAQLNERNRLLESAKRQADSILASVPSRLMLIDSSLEVQGSFSTELASVFRVAEGQTFLDVLQKLVPEATFEAARDHVTALFDATIDERTLAAANPLRSVQVTAVGDDGALIERGVGFTFRRILENGEIAHVLVAIEDTTEWIESEKRLRDSEEQKSRQFETLLEILNVEPAALEEFVKNGQAELDAIDRTLRTADFAAGSSQMGVLRQRLGHIGERVGILKESATLLRFARFAERAATLRELLAGLKAKTGITGEEFLGLVLAQADFRAEFDNLQTLRFKLAALRRASHIASDAGDEIVASLTQLSSQLSSELGKEVTIDADGFGSKDLAPERRSLVRDILIELTRNAIVHGIEEPTEREAGGRPRAGTIEIRPRRDALAGSFAFTVRDNGRGLDPVRIRDRAVALGMLDAERANAMSDSDAAGYIFVPGFTTADEVLGTPARGMGLSTVKRKIVDECGGTIAIDSEGGAFCEFSFVIPPHRGASGS